MHEKYVYMEDSSINSWHIKSVNKQNKNQPDRAKCSLKKERYPEHKQRYV